MMTKLQTAGVMAAMLLFQLPAMAQKVSKTTLIEKVTRKGDELVISYVCIAKWPYRGGA
jgi:hypothetical protein